MYLDYWGFQEKPFENTPNPRFLFPSKQHREGLRKLLYAITEGKGCALLTGEYGCGKTHLIRTLVRHLNNSSFEIGIINCPIFDGKEFLDEVLYQFGRDEALETRLQCFRELSTLFYNSISEGKTNVLIVDEAQIIDEPEVFEELRLLLNIQLEDQFLLNIQLVGQPELIEHIDRFPQLEQRIAVKIHLEPFDREDTVNYVKYRIQTAGCEKPAFSDAALQLIHKISGGVPRRVNNLCDLCLLYGADNQVKTISEGVLKEVL